MTLQNHFVPNEQLIEIATAAVRAGYPDAEDVSWDHPPFDNDNRESIDVRLRARSGDTFTVTLRRTASGSYEVEHIDRTPGGQSGGQRTPWIPNRFG